MFLSVFPEVSLRKLLNLLLLRSTLQRRCPKWRCWISWHRLLRNRFSTSREGLLWR